MFGGESTEAYVHAFSELYLTFKHTNAMSLPGFLKTFKSYVDRQVVMQAMANIPT